MNSSLYARFQPILQKLVIFVLTAASLVFTSQTARAETAITVGLNPAAVTVDSQGNAYTANLGSGTISKISPNGQVSTFADLNPQKPTALILSPSGNLYVGTKAGTLFSITPEGVTSTFATVGKNPVAMIFDAAGNLYTANYIDSSISKVTPEGQVSRFAVVGTWPSDIAMDSLGNLYTASYLDGFVSKVSPTGQVTTFASVGSYPSSLVIDSANNLFVTNSADNTISKITPAGTSTVFATVGKSPNSIEIDASGNLYTANYLDNTVTKVSSSGIVSTFAVTGDGPTAIHYSTNSNLYIANNLSSSLTVRDANGYYSSAPRSLQANTTKSTQAELSWQAPLSVGGSAVTDYLVEATTNNGNTLVGTYRVGTTSTSFTFPGLCSKQAYQLKSYAINSSGLSAASNQITLTPPNGEAAAPANLVPTLVRGTSVALSWDAPSCDGGASVTDYRISFSSDSGQSWVTVSKAASASTSHTVTGLVLGRNYLFRLSSVNSFGEGLAGAAVAVTTAESTSLYTVGSSPAAMAFDAAGNVYVANTMDNSISKITTNGVVSRFATVGDNPAALVFDGAGNLYVANSDEGTITKISPQATATLFATVGDRPSSLVFDSSGNLYSADAISGTISKVTPSGEVSVFADLASNPTALVIDSVGNLYSANGRDSTVSKITPTGQITKLTTLPIAASRMVSDSSGNLYVFSTVSSKIYKITPTGELSVFISLSDSVTDFVLDAKNNFYFANSTDGTISKLTAAGMLSTLAVFEDTIVRIASDSNGNLFTSFDEGKVAKSVLGKTPTAPRSLSSPQQSSSTISLSWTAPESNGGSAITEYQVEQSAAGVSSWDLVAKTSSTVLQVTNLEPQSGYRFRVLAINGLGQSPYSNELSVSTTIGSLSNPRNLEISQVSSSSLILSWLAPTSTGGQAITNYLVEYSGDSGVTWAEYTKPVSTETFLALSQLTPAKTYSFRVVAITSSATSSPSTAVSATTLAAAPSSPRNLAFSAVTKSSLTLSWQAPLNTNGSAITNYQVEISPNNGSSWSMLDKPISTSNGMNVTGLTAGTTYQFKVYALNSVGRGEASEAKSITTAQVSIPSAPASVTFSNNRATSFSITWSAVSSPVKVRNYIVEISRDGNTWNAAPKRTSTVTSLSIGNLLPGTNYKLRVAAVNAEGQSPFTQAAITTLATVPSASAKPTASEITSSSIKLSWLAPTSGGSEITNYLVEISGGGSSWTEVSKPISTDTALNITGLKPATKYMFRLKAVNSVGVSKVSSSASFTTFATAPAIPTNLLVKSQTASSLTLTWTAPSNGGTRIIDYRVEYSLDQGESWLIVAKNAASSASATLRGLNSKTSYLFRVTAKNSVGFGGVSQNITVTTP